MTDDETLTLPQIADLLGVNPSTVRWWVSQKRLPARMVGRRWLVRRADLEHMLATAPRIGRAHHTQQTTPHDLTELDLLSQTEPLRHRR